MRPLPSSKGWIDSKCRCRKAALSATSAGVAAGAAFQTETKRRISRGMRSGGGASKRVSDRPKRSTLTTRTGTSRNAPARTPRPSPSRSMPCHLRRSAAESGASLSSRTARTIRAAPSERASRAAEGAAPGTPSARQMEDITTASSTSTPSMALVVTASAASERAAKSGSWGSRRTFSAARNARAKAASSSFSALRAKVNAGHSARCQLNGECDIGRGEGRKGSSVYSIIYSIVDRLTRRAGASLLPGRRRGSSGRSRRPWTRRCGRCGRR